jgi:hypothetical protein
VRIAAFPPFKSHSGDASIHAHALVGASAGRML